MNIKMEDNQIIKWQFKYLESQREKISDTDLAWAIQLEEALKKQKQLSKRQKEVLESIYSRY